MDLSLEIGLARLLNAEALVSGFESAAAGYGPAASIPRDLFADTFGVSGELTDGPTTPELRRSVLRKLGIVEVSPGRGGPTRRAGGGNVAPKILAAAKGVWGVLSGGSCSAAQVERLVAEQGLDTVHSTSVLTLLKELGLAVRVQGSGDLRLPRAVDIKPPPTDIVKRAEQTGDEQLRRLEHEYYEAFESFLVDSEERDGTQAYDAVATLGVVQRLEGEWSTPDLIAVSVKSSTSLIVPIVRVTTVEVKLKLSRLAIAEAKAHKRFAHFSYVGTPEAPVDVDPELMTELAQAGLGLICPRQKNSQTLHTYLEPAFHRPDEADVDGFLTQCRSKDGAKMSDRVHELARKAMGVLFT